MKSHSRLFLVRGVLAVISTVGVGSGSAFAAAQGTAFTYQGRLTDGGNAPTGTYDLQFRLFDALSGGAQVGSTLQLDNVSVTGGLFTVQLDFGTQFDGNARWLDLGVHPGALPVGNPYTVLTPRQPLNAAPYALYALSGPGGSGPWTVNGTNIYNTNTGDVGIGTTSPSRLLHTVGDAVLFERAINDAAVILRNTLNGTLNAAFGLHNSGASDGYAYLTDQTQTPLLHLRNGNVGIGSTTPLTKLHVTGGAENTTLADGTLFIQSAGGPFGQIMTMDGNEINGWSHLHLNPHADTDVFLVEGGGRVAIGTASTNGKFHVTTAVAGETAINAIVTANSGAAGFFSNGLNSNFSGDTLTAFCVGNANSQAFVATHAGLGDCAVFEITSASGGEAVEAITNGSGQAVLGTNTGTGQAGYFRILNPASGGTALYCETNGTGLAFQANGTARVDVLEITGADLAEKFPVSDEVKPGMVVMIDADHSGKLCLARGVYNRRVAGIVSGANGLPVGAVLGNLPASQDGPAIALSGRVWVWCDASTNAIEPGDLLTTSDSAGHAMKASDSSRAQGAVLGKAMTRLGAGETGLVLVLVTLQ